MRQLLQKILVCDCSQCGKSHTHQIMIEFTDLSHQGAFFAGKSVEKHAAQTLSEECRITLICPQTGLPMQTNVKVQIPAGERIKTIKEIREKQKIEENFNIDTECLEKEYFTWKNQVLITIRSFADKMLNLNASSIGILITLLTFLSGEDKINKSDYLAVLLGGCFILYIVSIISSSLIILPIYMNPENIEEFEKMRNNAVKRYHLFSVISMTFFILAVLLSVFLLLKLIFDV